MRRTDVRRGYTLLEALMAAIILVIALPFLTRWVLAGRQAQVGNLRSDQATSVAAQVLDSLGRLPRAARPPDTTGSTLVVEGLTYTLKWGYQSGGSYTTSYASTSTNPGSAWVTVGWNAGSASRTTRLEGVLP